MTTLGLDPATKTGWAICDDDERVLASGMFNLKTVDGASLFSLAQFLNSLIARYKVTAICYEQPIIYGGGSRLMGTRSPNFTGPMISGIIQVVAHEAGLPVASCHNATLKKWATGSGKAKKPEMTAEACIRTGRRITDHNEADAILIALYGAAELEW